MFEKLFDGKNKKRTKEEFQKELQTLIDKLSERDLEAVIILASTKEEVAIGMIGGKDDLFTTARNGVMGLMGAFMKLEKLTAEDAADQTKEIKVGESEFMADFKKILGERPDRAALMKALAERDPDFSNLKTPTDPKQIN